MKKFSGKQGIEIEMFVKNQHLEIEHDSATSIFAEHINSRTYYDDGKPEFPSNPYESLGDLEDEVRNYLIHAYEICGEKEWFLTLIGSDPFRIDFSSMHIHNSIESIPTREAIYSMREHLFSIQPFIALLSQNSSLSDGKVTYCKDARLAYSIWSRFSKYDSRDQSHYLSLASGELGHGKNKTLEVRLPSSSILEQIFANLVLVKAFIQLSDVPILPLSQCKENFFKVVRYGGEAIIPILKPTGVGYLGVKGKNVYIKISELFGLLLKDPDLESLIKASLKEVSASLRSRIIEFFGDITKGYTMSDFILQAYLLNPNDYQMETILDQLVSNSCKGISYKEILEAPEKPYYPIIEKSISLEELEEMLDKENYDFIIDSKVTEVGEILKDFKKGVPTNTSSVTLILRTLSLGNSTSLVRALMTRTVKDYFVDHEIMTEDYGQGRVFNAVLQEAEKMGIV